MPMYVYGGRKLLQALRSIQQKLGRAELVRVGFLAGATYPGRKKRAIRDEYRRRAKLKANSTINVDSAGNATIEEESEALPVAQVAAWNEYGDPGRGRPARPFFRTMIDQNKGHWGEDLGALLKANGYNTAKALALMGETMRAELQASIRDGKWAKLAESTAKAKGFDTPLIDTAHMLNSVDYEVQA